MIVQTYIKEIRSYRATAGAATKKAQSHAQFAADCYARAAEGFAYAASLMRSGRLDPVFAERAAEWEATAAMYERLGDRYIQNSAFQDKQAVFYRDLAARYAAMSRKIEIDV